MNENSIKKIKNAQGLRKIEETKLAYSKQILSILEQDPSIIMELLESLETTEDTFINKLSGEEDGNISFYDQSFNTAKEIFKMRDNQKSKKSR